MAGRRSPVTDIRERAGPPSGAASGARHRGSRLAYSRSPIYVLEDPSPSSNRLVECLPATPILLAVNYRHRRLA
jgi:hypothetical protein